MDAVEEKVLGGIASFEKSVTNYSIRYTTGEYAKLSILNKHVFRYYMSPTGIFLEYPIPISATNVAKINSKAEEDYDKQAFNQSFLEQSELHFIVHTDNLQIIFNKLCGKIEVYDKRTNQHVLKEYKPIHYSDSTSKQTLKQSHDEYFFGGGMQNGRFTHKGEILHIVNTNYWVDGGYTSSIPFYWSTKGYGVLRNTWQNGRYDIGSKVKQIIEIDHEEYHFDAFYFINRHPKDIFNDYYELTGKPVLMPEYAYYEAHINTYNINYWYECGPSCGSMICDNGRYYEPYNVSTSHGHSGILGSLNGEKTKYEFSARNMIDCYNGQDCPLGWFVPNDKSGYGQTDSLEGDLENLKSFVEYANAEGVHVALWTDGCLEPKDLECPVKENRDLSREVNVGVVAIKCNGDSFSFGLDAVENATRIFVNSSKNKVRPFMIINEGWAGLQRYACICKGDMTGGIWEYIRLYIPSLIGAGLSGLPFIGSDLDGMYGGGDVEVNIRDFQWKTFTPIQLNTDGSGLMEKTPFGCDCIIPNELNRASLKLKSMLFPYNYTIGYESIHGLPMIRAMFLEFPKECASYTRDSQYQYMWGPSILVAPVYANPDVHCRPQMCNCNWTGSDFLYQKPKYENIPVRNGVYLPDAGQVWIDLLTGKRYQGGKIYNNIKTPLWKIPVLVKDGAIIPLVNANNNPTEINRACRIFLIYPNGETTFEVYEDDGKSTEYLEQKYAKTTITVDGPASNENGNVSINIHKTKGSYRDLVKERSSVLQIMASDNVESIKAFIGDKIINIESVKSKEEFQNNDNVYYFDQKFVINPYITERFVTDELYQKFLHINIEKVDVTNSEIKIEIKGFSNKDEVFGSNFTVIEDLEAPKYFTASDKDITATSITLRWEVNNNISFYEIERDSTTFSNIFGDKFTFKHINCESKHSFRIRSVQNAIVSEWSDSIVAETKKDPYIGTVENVIVSCSIPCEFQQEVCNLSEPDCSWWVTQWHLQEELDKITLSFDLNDVHEISKIAYVPREDAGNGTFLKIQYRHSMDGENWTTMSPAIYWDNDDSTKVIDMDGAKFKCFELEVLDAVLGYASGRNILFYKVLPQSSTWLMLKKIYLGASHPSKKLLLNIQFDNTTGEYATLSILNNHVFRYYMSPTGLFLDYPTPINDTDVAKINIKAVKDYGKLAFDQSVLTQSEHLYIVQTKEIQIVINKIRGTLAVHDKRTDKSVLNEHEPVHYSKSTSKQTLHQSHDEYFFGGGMQNGRFTHKGEIIHIVNTNNWVDGGVTSPNPFYWSTKGYGVLRNTWQTGSYDFGTKDPQIIETCHNEDHLDAFYFINSVPKDILNDYYELTGRPIFMPEFAFYEAHLNTFNRDYWVEVSPVEHHAILFEDGKYYKSFQPQDLHDKTGILESLNGEKNNYQFSARAMIDRYKKHDIPLGWFVPNDGYGSGYGQTDTLEGDLENLKAFAEYANENGVEVALWTESCLEPKDPQHPKKGERDLSQEVNVGTVALKCDVAWIGEGYSFALNAVENATKIFLNRAQTTVRPLIIMVDGWAGTQRYAAIWSGDQTGGKWEYIRFHIPTYIGSGLSGLPIVGSDMDGIYGGGDMEVNIRDFQWKTFTPLQLNMDGWGNIEKTPFSFKAKAIHINKAYLKLKSMLMPYNYSIGHESIQGLPMIRAMFLEFPQERPAYTKDSQYQFMWGPSILVAPVYAKPIDKNVPVRDRIYLPDPGQVWIDLLTGDKYQGGKIYNNIKTPIWKIPVFVKDGAIVPLVNANNNLTEIDRACRIFLIYPNGETRFKVYEDDGKSSEYLEQKYAKTAISVKGPASNEYDDLSIYIHKTAGNYRDLVRERSTVLQIMASDNVKSIKAVINENNINIERVKTKEEFQNSDNVYYFDRKFVVNPYLEKFDRHKLYQTCLRIKIEETNVTESEILIKIKGYSNKGEVFGSISNVIESLKSPKYFTSFDEETTATSITLRWKNNNATYYEIERDGDTIFSNILGESFAFYDFKYDSKHSFRIRSVCDKGVSKWSYSIVVETKEEPHKDTVKDITVSCNAPCQRQQEISNLIKIDCNWWHTDWNTPWQAAIGSSKKITLSFDLNDFYEIRKIEYVPREDAGNGTFLKIQYRHSMDGENWTAMSPIISWDCDESTKVIEMDGAKFKYFELDVLDSVGGFGSGRNMLFYKKT